MKRDLIEPCIKRYEEALKAAIKVNPAIRVTVGHDGLSWPRTSDARVWADEFCRLNKASDHGTMLGWFANAIEAGADRWDDVLKIRWISTEDVAPDDIPSDVDEREFLFIADGCVYYGTHHSGNEFRDQSGQLVDAEAWIQVE